MSTARINVLFITSAAAVLIACIAWLGLRSWQLRKALREYDAAMQQRHEEIQKLDLAVKQRGEALERLKDVYEKQQP